MRVYLGFVIFSISLLARGGPELFSESFSTVKDLVAFNERAPVKVMVNDEISDGCWRSPNSSETAAKLELKRSSRLYSDDEDVLWRIHRSPILILTGFGYKTESGVCIAHVSAEILMKMSVSLGTFSDVTLVSKSIGEQLLSGPADSMSQRINQAHQDMVKKFLVGSNAEAKKEYRSLVETDDSVTDEERLEITNDLKRWY